MPQAYIVKQSHEQFYIGVEFAGKLPAGVSLSTGIVFASLFSSTLTTTLSAAANSGATTISVAANVGKGANVILNPNGSTKEYVKAVSVSGSGPYTVTLSQPLINTHALNESISYNPGKTETFLDSPTALVSGTQALRQIRNGIIGECYLISFLMTLDNDDIVEEDLRVYMREFF
jgi:hypothetical protein